MAQDKNAYSDTLNLPQTEFPMRAGLPINEPKWVEKWAQEGIYYKVRKLRKGQDKFILHCGPPYANGHLHLGHLLSYVIKDFVVRSKAFAGFDTPFVRGWDCHGLPIEWKVEQELRAKGKTKDSISKKELRALCRASAKQWSETQKAEWDRFGVLADEKVYRTMDPKNEAGTLREIGKLAAGGFLYKGSKSVMWSPVEETALAEAEIEYADHESTAIYVAFKLENRENEHVVIWTTTPWTMPANKAVAYGKTFTYALLQPTKLNEKATAQAEHKYWVAKDLAEDFAKMTGMEEFSVVAEQQGSAFEGWVARHPFYDQTSPMIEGFHVTVESGTGFVHTAPAHGAEDFQIGQQFGLDTNCHVQGDGTYDSEVMPLPTTGEALAGKLIWDAQKSIIAEMTENGSLLRWYKFKHQYPVSWRSKKPVIFRTTPQWMVAMSGEGALKENILKNIKKVKGFPAVGENRISGMMENRPDWCISRQRTWGVPIAVFKNTKTGEYIFDQEVFESIAKQIEVHGIDAWEELPTRELLPAGWLEKNGVNEADLEREQDIMDVWMDSGTSFSHVIMADESGDFKREGSDKECKLPADMYSEGSDQHRGWFNSSISISVANYGQAPYAEVLTHGFVVDGDGRKMSKSLGNGVEPADLMKKYGMDIVRLWVAASDYSGDVRISDEIMKGQADAYRRFRNTFRFILGNLNGFDGSKTVAYNDLPELEKWLLARLSNVLKQARKDYAEYKFSRVYQALYHFCSEELSSLYFDIRKDALYCDSITSKRRLACQTVLEVLLKALTTYMAPIMPFTSDEAFRSWFGESESVHLQEFVQEAGEWGNDALVTKWEKALTKRDSVNIKLEELRSNNIIGSSLEAKVKLGLSADEGDLKDFDWAELLIVSEVELTDGECVEVSPMQAEKCPRCWQRTDTVGSNSNHSKVCGRCAEALEKDANHSAA